MGIDDPTCMGWDRELDGGPHEQVVADALVQVVGWVREEHCLHHMVTYAQRGHMGVDPGGLRAWPGGAGPEPAVGARAGGRGGAVT